MLFKSPVYSQVSGSVAGLTYAHNSAGLYVRGRSIPTNPNTVRQQIARSALNGGVQAWEMALTGAQRTSWGVYAAAVSVTGKLGDPLFLSPQQMYIRCRSARAQSIALANAVGMTPPAAMPATAPTTLNTGENVIDLVDPFQITETGGSLATTFALASPASDDGDLLLYVGPAVSAGTNFFKGPYQLASVFGVASAATSITWGADTTDPADWISDQLPVAGERRPVRAVMIYDDGRVAEAWSAIVPVVAGV